MEAEEVLLLVTVCHHQLSISRHFGTVARGGGVGFGTAAGRLGEEQEARRAAVRDKPVVGRVLRPARERRGWGK